MDLVQSAWMDVLHQALLLVIQLAVAGLLIWVHRLLPLLTRYTRQHLTDKERVFLERVGREAFLFAETAFRGQDGQAKLAQALQYASFVADSHGLKVSPDELRTAVEQGWWEAQQSNGGTKKQP